MVVHIAIGDLFEYVDKNSTKLNGAAQKIKGENAVILEHLFRVMNGAVKEFEDIEKLVIALESLSRRLCDIYKQVESTLDGIDKRRRGDIVRHKDLERKVASVYTRKKRWGGEMIRRAGR